MTHSTPWIKATASDSTGSCVEMRGLADAVEIRDTKQHGHGPILGINRTAFGNLLTAAKDGELDRLA